MSNSILTLVTFIPAIGAVLLMLMPRNDRALRWTALIISLVAFAFSVFLPLNMGVGAAATGFQFQTDVSWIRIGDVNIHYHLGADGISMWLTLLTTFLVPLGVLRPA